MIGLDADTSMLVSNYFGIFAGFSDPSKGFIDKNNKKASNS